MSAGESNIYDTIKIFISQNYTAKHLNRDSTCFCFYSLIYVCITFKNASLFSALANLCLLKRFLFYEQTGNFENVEMLQINPGYTP